MLFPAASGTNLTSHAFVIVDFEHLAIFKMTQAKDMNFWIFQSVVGRNDPRETVQEGKADSRLASRYRQQMSSGDLVFFWLAGPDEIRGIYGWGTLLSAPYFNPDRQEFRVDVRYGKRLKAYIPASKIRSIDELKNLLILRTPQATNFILSRTEAQAIARLMDRDERPKTE